MPHIYGSFIHISVEQNSTNMPHTEMDACLSSILIKYIFSSVGCREIVDYVDNLEVKLHNHS